AGLARRIFLPLSRSAPDDAITARFAAAIAAPSKGNAPKIADLLGIEEFLIH
ncbi:hypothetical protein A2U01_0084888, partial [Trifolium medium]|nr:hypothetical protein [Trifolium medium]